jgi:hypothetical protein
MITDPVYWKHLLLSPRTLWREFKYWQITRRIQRLRPWLATKYPKWVVTDALIHAGVRKIREQEVVPEVTFMDVYERWYREGRKNPNA